MNKILVWLHGEVQTPPFSSDARIETGFLLRRLQQGEMLSLPVSRPMPTIGVGCHELRVQDRDVSWRLIYCIDADAIIVLEVFEKKTQATPQNVIKTCKRRLSHYRSEE